MDAAVRARERPADVYIRRRYKRTKKAHPRQKNGVGRPTLGNLGALTKRPRENTVDEVSVVEGRDSMKAKCIFWTLWFVPAVYGCVNLVSGSTNRLGTLKGAIGCNYCNCSKKTLSFDECAHESVLDTAPCDDLTCMVMTHYYAECPEVLLGDICPIAWATPYLSSKESLRDASGPLCSPGSVSPLQFIALWGTDCKRPGAVGRCEPSGECSQRAELGTGYTGYGPYCLN